MKKKILCVVSAVLCLALALTACGQKEEGNEAVNPEPDKSVQTVELSFDEPGTEDAKWTYTADNEGVLVEKGSEVKEKDGKKVRVFTFEAGKDGTVTLTFDLTETDGERSTTASHIYEYKVENGKAEMLSASQKTHSTVADKKDDDTAEDASYVSYTMNVKSVTEKDGKFFINGEDGELVDDQFEADGEIEFELADDADIFFSEDFGAETEKISAVELVEVFASEDFPASDGVLFEVLAEGTEAVEMEFIYTP